MTVGRFCVREVDLADPDESVQVAANRMHSRVVGTLVVLDENKHPIGIITDRDLAIKVVGGGKDPFTTRVREVMTTRLRTVREETPLEEALGIMRAGPFRRLPVVDAQGKLVGLLTLDDVIDLLREELDQIAELLHKESPESLKEP